MEDFAVLALRLYGESHFFFFLSFLFFFMISAWTLERLRQRFHLVGNQDVSRLRRDAFRSVCLLSNCFGHLHENSTTNSGRGANWRRPRDALSGAPSAGRDVGLPPAARLQAHLAQPGGL